MTMSTILESSRPDQEAAIEFSQQLLRDWMRQNTIEGMNIYQSLWMFTRFESSMYTLPWGSVHVDIFKMFQSGAVPTLYYILLRIQPDPMTMPYHWLTQARIDWVKNKISAYIGPDVTASIQALA
jgi:hypothetical protein